MHLILLCAAKCIAFAIFFSLLVITSHSDNLESTQQRIENAYKDSECKAKCNFKSLYLDCVSDSCYDSNGITDESSVVFQSCKDACKSVFNNCVQEKCLDSGNIVSQNENNGNIVEQDLENQHEPQTPQQQQQQQQSNDESQLEKEFQQERAHTPETSRSNQQTEQMMNDNYNQRLINDENVGNVAQQESEYEQQSQDKYKYNYDNEVATRAAGELVTSEEIAEAVMNIREKLTFEKHAAWRRCGALEEECLENAESEAIADVIYLKRCLQKCKVEFAACILSRYLTPDGIDAYDTSIEQEASRIEPRSSQYFASEFDLRKDGKHPIGNYQPEYQREHQPEYQPQYRSEDQPEKNAEQQSNQEFSETSQVEQQQPAVRWRTYRGRS